MASAMYWVASAANGMYIEGETDMVGSIGVVQRLAWEPADPNSLELVRGKYKRLSVNGAPPSAEVIAQAEQQLDYIYSLFVDTVAVHRGVGSEQVLERMADGRVFIGQQAIDAGLVDGVSTVSAMVEKLATNPAAFARRRKAVFALGAPDLESHLSASAGAAQEDEPTEKGPVMPQADNTPVSRESLERDHPSLFAQLRTEFSAAGEAAGAAAGAAAERQRIQAVLAQGAAMPGHAALVQQLAFDGKTTPAEAALQIIAAEQSARGAAAAAHAADAPPAARSSPAADAAAAAAETPKSIAARAVALLHSHRPQAK